ncbi:bifunctional phosphoribosyl-AMP cyclohydrolase/phosphoribosyl-ATP diphosphatase HisIE [Ammoniphilus sp. CFH 90114]|uniref:bifunctional phosphoribosyl-AMP cyclohydrolase/phosphoribosyl-ATP diphosphatase HisIE n=1 Tax=Ammoniphilus sp. CFH 90114 TaxID=2493665 RepID=UPI00100DBF42|nr:bifunctional phosphoribosyl-AMP cyclohydrolase/phosphoribosyl-ATP diphosphatase HisIE [Ammoniphilus sp. CFH 90114]RXT04032.1 bifunctional phosphoribosyl-AMP cyclohydrolase/phosphoribosyl-ATP diphosphatase HisIE [Ammoniphilus sp. CFH 90114]
MIAWENIKFDEKGLVPAIVQDAASKEVLMMAYMSRESLQQTLDKGETVFWSRSREELWHKGATSGNTQKVVSISLDCDGDTLLIKVQPAGPACHRDTYTCFDTIYGQDTSMENRFAILSDLESLIAKRDAERPEGAYTTYLFEKGVDKILKKVGEEASEVIIAAKNRDPEELRYEASDLLYHLLVLLREQRLPLDEVLQELSRRHKK